MSQALLEKAVSEQSYVEVNGKPAPQFKYMNAAEAAQVLGNRRRQVRMTAAPAACVTAVAAGQGPSLALLTVTTTQCPTWHICHVAVCCRFTSIVLAEG